MLLFRGVNSESFDVQFFRSDTIPKMTNSLTPEARYTVVSPLGKPEKESY